MDQLSKPLLVWAKSRSLSPTSLSADVNTTVFRISDKEITHGEELSGSLLVLPMPCCESWGGGVGGGGEHAALNLVQFSFIWRDIINFLLSSECPGNKGSGIVPRCLGCCLDCFQRTGMWWCRMIYILNENASCNYQNFTQREIVLLPVVWEQSWLDCWEWKWSENSHLTEAL